MTTNYREQAITGSKWVRSNRVTITHPYNGLSTIAFGEEEITMLSDGRTHTANLPGIRQAFDNPNTTFDLLNPQTGEVIGTASHLDVYVMLNSLYRDLAAKRDAAEAEAAALAAQQEQP